MFFVFVSFNIKFVLAFSHWALGVKPFTTKTLVGLFKFPKDFSLLFYVPISILNIFTLYFILQSFPACTSTRCRFGAKCELQEDGSESCVCERSCRLGYVPVCGNNKKTYLNRCALDLDTCVTNGTVSLAHEGKCCRNSHL